MQGTIINRVYHKYEKESSKLRFISGGAWTINLDIVDLKNIDTVIYETKKNIYRISKQKANEVGISNILGGELKLIIPLIFWEKIKKENKNAVRI